MKRAFLVVIAILAFADTGSAQGKKKTKKLMDSWLNSTKQQLILSWGPPSSTTSDGGDGEILIYSRRVYVPAQQYGQYRSPGVDYYNYKMFYVNSQGTIFSWRTENNPNPPERVDVEVYVR